MSARACMPRRRNCLLHGLALGAGAGAGAALASELVSRAFGSTRYAVPVRANKPRLMKRKAWGGGEPMGFVVAKGAGRGRFQTWEVWAAAPGRGRGELLRTFEGAWGRDAAQAHADRLMSLAAKAVAGRPLFENRPRGRATGLRARELAVARAVLPNPLSWASPEAAVRAGRAALATGNGAVYAYALGWSDGFTAGRSRAPRDAGLHGAKDDYARGYSVGYAAGRAPKGSNPPILREHPTSTGLVEIHGIGYESRIRIAGILRRAGYRVSDPHAIDGPLAAWAPTHVILPLIQRLNPQRRDTKSPARALAKFARSGWLRPSYATMDAVWSHVRAASTAQLRVILARLERLGGRGAGRDWRGDEPMDAGGLGGLYLRDAIRFELQRRGVGRYRPESAAARSRREHDMLDATPYDEEQENPARRPYGNPASSGSWALGRRGGSAWMPLASSGFGEAALPRELLPMLRAAGGSRTTPGTRAIERLEQFRDGDRLTGVHARTRTPGAIARALRERRAAANPRHKNFGLMFLLQHTYRQVENWYRREGLVSQADWESYNRIWRASTHRESSLGEGYGPLTARDRRALKALESAPWVEGRRKAREHRAREALGYYGWPPHYARNPYMALVGLGAGNPPRLPEPRRRLLAKLRKELRRLVSRDRPDALGPQIRRVSEEIRRLETFPIQNPPETFRAAWARLQAGLAAQGWRVQAGLKIPHATSPDGRVRVWFRPQALWASPGTDCKTARSIGGGFMDPRALDAGTLARLAHEHAEFFGRAGNPLTRAEARWALGQAVVSMRRGSRAEREARIARAGSGIPYASDVRSLTPKQLRGYLAILKARDQGYFYGRAQGYAETVERTATHGGAGAISRLAYKAAEIAERARARSRSRRANPSERVLVDRHGDYAWILHACGHHEEHRVPRSLDARAILERLSREACSPCFYGRRPARRAANPPPRAAGEYTLEQARALDARGFALAAKAVQRFHKAAPARVRVFRYDDGKPGVTRQFVAGLGPVPETHYLGTFTSSNKHGVHWVHKHPKGGEPLEVLDPRTGLTMKVGGKFRVTDWWHR